jgi:hypothetical protein
MGIHSSEASGTIGAPTSVLTKTDTAVESARTGNVAQGTGNFADTIGTATPIPWSF